VLGAAWDGTGLGTDGTVWGGEFLEGDGAAFRRVARFRPFPLPGGERAIREPRRSALGLLWEHGGDDAVHHAVGVFEESEFVLLRRALARNLNSPRTSSVGRLFDAVASLAGLRHRVSFEGQAAMELEFALGDRFDTDEHYPFELVSRDRDVPFRCIDVEPAIAANDGVAFEVDWAPMLEALLEDVRRGTPNASISARFHNMLVEVLVAVARKAGRERVLLTGGCFQNAALTERAVKRLRHEGFSPAHHREIPPNDGGIALGQAVGLARALGLPGNPDTMED
jgi:hydrogenase maturation protein HypF